MTLDAVFFNTFAAVVLLVIALLGAYMPVVLAQWGKMSGTPGGRSLAYVLGNMLSAGVMVSAGFVHLLGTAIKELDPMDTFPLAPFLCGLGLMMTLIADHVAETLSQRAGWGGGGHGLCAPAPSLDADAALLQQVIVADGAEAPEVAKNGAYQPSAAAAALAGGGGAVVAGVHAHAYTVVNGSGDSPRSNSSRLSHSTRPGRLREDAAVAAVAGGEPDHGAAGSRALREHAASGLQRRAHTTPLDSETERLVAGMPDSAAGGDCDAAAAQGPAAAAGLLTGTSKAEHAQAQVSFLTAALMAVALCFHSVLEGMAMGAQVNIVDSVHIFIAIAAHKGLAAYALGSSVVDSQAGMRKFWTVIGLFASATPVGILLGVVLSTVANSDGAASVSALASGTFLYVAFMEVIPRELGNPSHRTLKLAMLMAGFGAMSLLAVWA
ncbi:hypothetical protein WJX81_006014 [Elliptochloris bilobata]|uniref:Uncharacterized protein n=1 Tax=Elliptochloris bilobata TaxID=381761 RepID=A0AAW1RYG8_9CHLO